MFGGKKTKRIQELERENENLKNKNENLKKTAASFDVLTQQLTSALEKANPATCLKEANNAYEQFLRVHVKVLDDQKEMQQELLKRLDQAKDKMEYLYQFLVVAGTRIGYLEGKMENFAVSTTKTKIKELVDAWNKCERKWIDS